MAGSNYGSSLVNVIIDHIAVSKYDNLCVFPQRRGAIIIPIPRGYSTAYSAPVPRTVTGRAVGGGREKSVCHPLDFIG